MKETNWVDLILCREEARARPRHTWWLRPQGNVLRTVRESTAPPHKPSETSRLADKYSEQVRKCISRTKRVNGAGNYRKAHWITQMGISGDCLHPGPKKGRGWGKSTLKEVKHLISIYLMPKPPVSTEGNWFSVILWIVNPECLWDYCCCCYGRVFNNLRKLLQIPFVVCYEARKGLLVDTPGAVPTGCCWIERIAECLCSSGRWRNRGLTWVAGRWADGRGSRLVSGLSVLVTRP